MASKPIRVIKTTKKDKYYPGKPITDAVTNGFFSVDDQWMVRYWNKAAEKLTGISAKTIIGNNLWHKLEGNIPTKFHEICQKVFSRDVPDHFEEYCGDLGIWSDVILYHCENTLSVSFKDKSTNTLESQEQQLRTLNELYRLVTEVTNDCLWEWNFQDREMFWIDGGHKRVFGFEIENALIPQSFWEGCVHPDDRTRILTKLRETIAGGSNTEWEVEYRFKRADGTFAYVHDRGHIIYNEEGKASRMIGATQDISARRTAEDLLSEEKLTKQKEITCAVLTTQEKERADIGKELHDNLNQVLGAAKLYIEMAKTSVPKRNFCLTKASAYIVDVIEEIRKISHTLGSPGMILPLYESIHLLLENLMMTHPIKITFHEHGIDDEDIDDKLQLDVYRIVQEQLNNIVKHANALQATIDITRMGNEIILLISDNGKGCDLATANAGMGSINVTSRAESHHGKVETVSSPGKGYELKVVLPLNGQIKNLAQPLSDYTDSE